MRVLETVTFLEMTSRRQLRRGRPVAALVMDQAGATSASLLRSTYDRIGAPFDWQGRRTGADVWSVERWAARLSQPGVHAWIARVGDEVAGMVEVEVRPEGDVEIVVFGLVPEFVGRGFGAHLLTVATELAWNAEPLDAPVRRVWLHTSSRDHPHARPNYERRGFRAFRTEQRRRQIVR